MTLIHVCIDKGLGELECQRISGMCGRLYNDNDSAVLMKGRNKSLMQQSLCEKLCGVYASCGALAALYSREMHPTAASQYKQGAGQTVSVDMLRTTMHNVLPGKMLANCSLRSL